MDGSQDGGPAVETLQGEVIKAGCAEKPPAVVQSQGWGPSLVGYTQIQKRKGGAGSQLTTLEGHVGGDTGPVLESPGAE